MLCQLHRASYLNIFMISTPINILRTVSVVAWGGGVPPKNFRNFSTHGSCTSYFFLPFRQSISLRLPPPSIPVTATMTGGSTLNHCLLSTRSYMRINLCLCFRSTNEIHFFAFRSKKPRSDNWNLALTEHHSTEMISSSRSIYVCISAYTVGLSYFPIVK